MASLRAELLLLRKRTATWILLAVSVLLSLLFTYILPYSAYLSDPASRRAPNDLRDLLPERFISSAIGGFPFYFGILTLILGVLAAGSEFGWGTLKTTLMQNPGRPRLLAAKLGALGIILTLFVIAVFTSAVLGSLVVATLEDAPTHWPAAWDIVRAFGAGWLVLALWTTFGVLLAVVSRGTALAIGLGIIYGLVVEGLITGFGNRIALLGDFAQGFLRTNGYSLVAPLRAVAGEADGPGAFSGPFVNTWQAFLVIAAYLLVFSGVAALLLRHRDVV